jgi:MFS family permease
VNLRGWPGPFLVLLGASIMSSTASGAAGPLLSLYVERDLHGSESIVGLVVSAGWIFSLASALLSGPFIDRHGRRPWAIAGNLIAITGMLGLVAAASPATVFACRALTGIGGGILGVTVMAWALDFIDEERRGRGLAAFGISVWVGLSIGPPLGHFVQERFGYDGLWIALAALFVGALAISLTLAERHRPAARGSGAPVGRGWRRWLPGGSERAVLAIASVAYGEGVLNAFLVLHLVGRGVSESAAAIVFTVFAVSVLAARVLGARLVDRFPPRALSAAAMVLDGAGLLVMALASSFWPAAAGAAIMGLGFSVLYPSLALIATDAAGPARRGAALGAFASAFSLGLAGGGLISGPVAELTGTGGAFVLAGAIAAGGALVILSGPRGRAQQEIEAELWPPTLDGVPAPD